MHSDTALSPVAFADNFSCISSNVVAHKALTRSNQCMHTCISELYTQKFAQTRVTHTIIGTHTKMYHQSSTLSLITPRHLFESLVATDGCCVSRQAQSEPEIPQCDPTAY